MQLIVVEVLLKVEDKEERAEDEGADDEGADNKEARCDEDEGCQTSIHVILQTAATEPLPCNLLWRKYL